MSILFISSYGLKFYTLIRVQIEKAKLSEDSFWIQVQNLNESSLTEQQTIYKSFYWLNNDRFYWFSLDPINLSEALYAIAIIFSFSRLCFWLPANQELGPLQITLGQMISVYLNLLLFVKEYF